MNTPATEPSDATLCTWCEGTGIVSTGIDEAPTTLCKRCDGTGYSKEKAAPAAAVGGGEDDFRKLYEPDEYADAFKGREPPPDADPPADDFVVRVPWGSWDKNGVWHHNPSLVMTSAEQRKANIDAGIMDKHNRLLVGATPAAPVGGFVVDVTGLGYNVLFNAIAAATTQNEMNSGQRLSIDISVQGFLAYIKQHDASPAAQPSAKDGADIWEAYKTWPEDIRAKLSCHDLRRMNGWTPTPNHDDWAIDTSAGGPILVYQNCSVIQDEQARYVLGLVAKDSAKDGVMGDDGQFSIASLIVRDACEMDPADPDHPDTIRIKFDDLINIVREHTATTASGLVDGCKDSERYRFLRNPANTTIYVKDTANWNGRAHPGGYFRYETPEQLDAAIDAQLEAAIGREVVPPIDNGTPTVAGGDL